MFRLKNQGGGDSIELDMDTKFVPSDHEKKIYDFWESNGYLRPTSGEPYTILMPPPNANASLHAGHGMYTIDDIMIRFKRLNGMASLWIPGLDHAGFETQYVYEKHLAKQGKSRFDFERDALYKDIFKFVKENSGLIFEQFKKLGFLADWERSVFTLDDRVVLFVQETFKKLVEDGFVYRDEYIVNYCTHDGTSLAELEIKYVERKDPLYYIKYGPFTLATVRPETKFGDTAIAVNPKDSRYKQWVGKEVEVDGLLDKFKLKVIADEYVNPDFGTGVVKVTPAHDPNDFEMGRRHSLEIKQVIGRDGRLTEIAGPYAGLKVRVAREKVAHDLQDKGLMVKIDKEYVHSVATCYKCGRDLEPLTIPNWYIKVETLKKSVIEAVKKDEVKFTPKKYKKQMLDWLEVMHDWPISRQIVWGIRIPAFYHKKENKWTIEIDEEKQKELLKNPDITQDTDTFDTWFSSGQWPLFTLKEQEFKTHFPTDFMGTLSDILKFWISRMILFSLYRYDKVPFKDVYLWSMVADSKGKKMSKSRGNVVNPVELIDKYGADAFRASLLFGVGQGGIVNLAEDKVRAMRNFANKIWNVGRFLLTNRDSAPSRHSGESSDSRILNKKDPGPRQTWQASKAELDSARMTIESLQKEYNEVKKQYMTDMEQYRFSTAFDRLYEFIWHRFADYYIEELKDAVISGNIEAYRELESVYLNLLILFHPFMPFVTEAVWKEIKGEESSILNERI